MRNGRPDQIGAPVLLSSHISRGTAIPGCALFIGGLPSRRDALWTTSGFRGGGLQSAIVPSLLCRSRSQTDDQELVLVVRLAAVDDDLSANLTAGEVDGVEVHISRSLADGTQRADQVARGDALGGRAGDIRRGDAA